MHEDDDVYTSVLEAAKQSLREDLEHLDSLGIIPTDALKGLLAERAISQAAAAVSQTRHNPCEHRVQAIIQRYRQRERELDRQGAKEGILSIPPILVMFTLLAWFGFFRGDVATGCVYVFATLAFLIMLLVLLLKYARSLKRDQ